MSEHNSPGEPATTGWRGWERPPAKKASPWPSRLIIGGLVTAVATPIIWFIVWYVDAAAAYYERDGNLVADFVHVGDCLGDTSDIEDGEEFATLPVVPCSETHLSEVYVSLLLDADGGNEWALGRQCARHFTSFIGVAPEESTLDWWSVIPAADGIKSGERRLLCVVESPGPVTGTLKGSRR